MNPAHDAAKTAPSPGNPRGNTPACDARSSHRLKLQRVLRASFDAGASTSAAGGKVCRPRQDPTGSDRFVSRRVTERNHLQPGRVRRFRDARRWSQQELASAAGLSRPEVSAVETGRVVPSVKVALALGRALGLSVEALFGADAAAIEWAWAPRKFPSRIWLAAVGARRLAFPCE